MKKIVIIGANDFQRPLIRKAREMGYETHVFAWREGATGAEDADYFYEISITENERILEECKKIGPDAVTTIGSDLANVTVQYLAEHLGLPGNSRECIEKSTNKYAMRRAFRDAGLPVPYFAAAGEGDAVNPPSYPVIVKPTDRSGSRAVTKVENYGELRQAIRRAVDQSFEKKAIVEEYLPGEEYSLEAISHQGVHTCLAITKKYTTGAPNFIETGHLEPAPLSPGLEEKIKQTVFGGLDALGIQTGASHSEFRVDREGNVRLIEIGSRMGGDCIGSHLVPLSTGLDFVKMTIQTAAGTAPEIPADRLHRCSAVRFIMEEKDLALLERIEKEYPQYIREKVLDGEPGSRQVSDSSTRFGFFILQTETMEQMEQLRLF